MTEPSASSEVKRASAASPAVPLAVEPHASRGHAVADDPLPVERGAERLADQMPGALGGRARHVHPIDGLDRRCAGGFQSFRVDPAGGDRAARVLDSRASREHDPHHASAGAPGRACLLRGESCGAARHPRRRSGDRRRGGHALQTTVGTADDDDVFRVERHPRLRGLDRAVEGQILRSRGDHRGLGEEPSSVRAFEGDVADLRPLPFQAVQDGRRRPFPILSAQLYRTQGPHRADDLIDLDRGDLEPEIRIVVPERDTALETHRPLPLRPRTRPARRGQQKRALVLAIDFHPLHLLDVEGALLVHAADLGLNEQPAPALDEIAEAEPFHPRAQIGGGVGGDHAALRTSPHREHEGHDQSDECDGNEDLEQADTTHA